MYFVFAFILWTVFWSFGSVILVRFKEGINAKNLKSTFFGYSECPACKHRLYAKNLIPFRSYFASKGKCAYCKKKISYIYPLLELLCGLVFVGTFRLTKDLGTGTIILGLLTNRMLVLLLVFDLMEYELHMVGRGILVILWTVANFVLTGGNILWAWICVVIFAVIFLWIYYFSKVYTKLRFKVAWEGFGMGDVFLAWALGLFLPLVITLHGWVLSFFLIWELLVLLLLLSSIIGLLRALVQLLIGRLQKMKKTCLPVDKVPEDKLFNFQNSKFKIIPFLPAMIIAFWLITIAWSFFISLLFPY